MHTLPEVRLVLEALVAISVLRTALLILPFRVVQRIRLRRARLTARPEAIIRAIESVARRIPNANCLTSVMAAALLFGRYGHAAEVRLGVARTNGRLEAHAWLESDGRSVLAWPASGTFVPLRHHGAD